MAIHRKQLHHRIKAHPVASPTPHMTSAMGAYHPAGTAETPMVMPYRRVVVGAAPDGQYVTLGAQEYAPLWTTDGALIPALAPGTWGQLAAAGRA
jgi:hypothetical protein